VLNSLYTQIGLVLVALISAAGGVYSIIASKSERDAQADKTAGEAEQINDQTWINRLSALGKDFDRLQTLSDERFARLVEIETLITEHVAWDFQIMRVLREHGIEVDSPPSLVYVRKKLKEAQSKEVEAKGIANGTA
jgi:hypothetical protein